MLTWQIELKLRLLQFAQKIALRLDGEYIIAQIYRAYNDAFKKIITIHTTPDTKHNNLRRISSITEILSQINGKERRCVLNGSRQ